MPCPLLLEAITSGQSNLTKGCLAGAHGRFSRIRQVVPTCTRPRDLIHASLGQPESTTQRVLRSVRPFVFAGLTKASYFVAYSVLLRRTLCTGTVRTSVVISATDCLFDRLSFYTDAPRHRSVMDATRENGSATASVTLIVA